MTNQKKMAVTISGCADDYYPSPYALTPEQKFDALWPRDQAKYMDLAKLILEETK